MEKAHKLEHRKRKTCPPRGAARRGSQPYPVELRLKLVKLRLEEGYPLELLCPGIRGQPECAVQVDR